MGYKLACLVLLLSLLLSAPLSAQHVSEGSPRSALIANDHPPLADAQPTAKVSAIAYGAKCIGTSFDDTAAIQSALKVEYAYNVQLLRTVGGVVELPAGTCRITKPLMMGLHGSLVGQGEATTLMVDYASWKGGSDHNALEIAITGPVPSGESVSQRRIAGFILMGSGNAGVHDSVGIHFYNTVAKYEQQYQVPYFNVADMMITGFDTGIEAEDWLSSSINNLNVTCVRQGVWLNGHAVNIQIGHSQLAYSECSNQHTSNHDPTVALLLSPNPKYCSNCTNYPQGVSFHDSSVVGFDYGVWVNQAITVSIHDSVLDYGADGLVKKGAAIRISTVGGGLFIHHNYLTVTPASAAYGIYSEANATDGIWIESNYFNTYAPGINSDIGIALTGTGLTRDWHINGNTFINYNVGIEFKQAVAYGELRGNFGSGISGELIDLAGRPGLIYKGMFVDGNTTASSVPVIRKGDARGMTLGTDLGN